MIDHINVHIHSGHMHKDTYNSSREDSPVNNPLASDVIRLPYKDLSVKGANESDTLVWWELYYADIARETETTML